MKKSGILVLLPIFFGFFVMGFVDIVGSVRNYVKADFSLNNTLANFLPMMVFLWFLILSVPVGLIMNKYGRKNTVLISLIITIIALLVPFINYSFLTALAAFALLGIGNTILQVSLNPLVTNVISNEKIPGSLTLGQFIKASSSFLGPVTITCAARYFDNWKLIFPVYAIVSFISAIWLVSIKIEKEKITSKTTTFNECIGLLKNNYILLLFISILLIVGVDVGMNTTIPEYLKSKFHLSNDQAVFDITYYFGAKIAGTFIGTFILFKIPIRSIFPISAIIAVIAFVSMLFISGLGLILINIVIIGLSCANVFSMIFSLAIQKMPEKMNEISGLMIMGVSGGALVLPVMGFLSDKVGQLGGMLVLLACLLYILIFSLTLPRKSDVLSA